MTLLLILLSVALLLSMLPFSAYASALDTVAKVFTLLFRPLAVTHQHVAQPAQHAARNRKFDKRKAVDTEYEEVR